eukprot:TRINITY_DN7591_c0_g1_i1.p1 TRINITY_DN7591_c0_g1~~TRINITY_DN7591_c0_g1_i1.p1  ORF type:complete len:267 (+),score=64.92 TRINITY_DN7591_c0_g1_i1:63-863(+)
METVVTVAEVATAAWDAAQSRAEHSGNAAAREREALAAEGALAHERMENKRLQAVLEEYKKTFEELQKRSAGVAWLRNELNSSEGTADVFERLQKRVESPEFLEKLRGPPESLSDVKTDPVTIVTKDGLMVNVDVEDPSWWLWVTDKDMYGTEALEEKDHLDGGSYVLVDQEDVVDGIANFVARYLMSQPQTKNMSAKELQQAISQAFIDLRHQRTMRRLWDWGRFLYTTSCWATTALGLYRNPVVVRAALIAVWTSCRIIVGLLR